jgi:prepilin-type N-terminal cleavage/methylation domain-containing protein
MRKTLAQGFTLVELLIVIALLGVIATIVIAAINPIEQANRASDAGMKADASQIVSAIQRYYVSHSAYPWENVTPADYTSSNVEFPFTTATDINIGVCGDTCAEGGELLTSDEIQNAFLAKKFITTTSADGMLYVGKGLGASSTVYVCWIPKSKSNRATVIKNTQVMDLTAGFTTAGLPVVTTGCDDGGAADTGWTTTAPALPTCAECVPE